VKEIQLKNELKSSTPGGKLILHIVFRPELVARKKQNSGGVVDGATRALTGIGTGVGSAVTNSGSFVGSKANSLVSGAGNVVGSGFGLLKKK
jgi:hypothetical protein